MTWLLAGNGLHLTLVNSNSSVSRNHSHHYINKDYYKKYYQKDNYTQNNNNNNNIIATPVDEFPYSSCNGIMKTWLLFLLDFHKSFAMKLFYMKEFTDHNYW